MLRCLCFVVLSVVTQRSFATETTPLEIRIEGVIDDTVDSPEHVVTGAPFLLSLALAVEGGGTTRYEIDENTNLDLLLETDIALFTGGHHQTWRSQFGALSMSTNGLTADVLFDLGSEVQVYLARKGSPGSAELDLASGIDFLARDFTDASLVFLFEPGSVGSFRGTISDITFVPEPSSLILFFVASPWLLRTGVSGSPSGHQLNADSG